MAERAARLSLRKLQPPRSDESSLLATAMVLRAFHSRLSRASMVKSWRRARGGEALCSELHALLGGAFALTE